MLISKPRRIPAVCIMQEGQGPEVQHHRQRPRAGDPAQPGGAGGAVQVLVRVRRQGRRLRCGALLQRLRLQRQVPPPFVTLALHLLGMRLSHLPSSSSTDAAVGAGSSGFTRLITQQIPYTPFAASRLHSYTLALSQGAECMPATALPLSQRANLRAMC